MHCIVFDEVEAEAEAEAEVEAEAAVTAAIAAVGGGWALDIYAANTMMEMGVEGRGAWWRMNLTASLARTTTLSNAAAEAGVAGWARDEISRPPSPCLQCSLR
jgi:hypothetical protein